MKSGKVDLGKLNSEISSMCAELFPEAVPVFGEGPAPARLMVIGEAPGRDETRLKRPFVGKGGSFFIKVFEESLEIKREGAYITNVLKIWPNVETERKRTRKPLKGEETLFVPFLLKEISIVKPEVILAVGKTAFSAVCPGEGFKAGSWYEFKNIRVMPLYHPSYMLRRQKSLEESTKELKASLLKIKKALDL